MHPTRQVLRTCGWAPVEGAQLRPLISLITPGHDAGDARLFRLVVATARTGWQTEYRALGQRENAPPVAALWTVPRRSMWRRALRSLTWVWSARGEVLLTADLDSAPMAWLASRLRGQTWVVDVAEDFLPLLADRAWVSRPLRPLLGAVVRLLNWVCAQADLTIVADDHVRPLTAKRRFVMRNVADLSLLPEPRPATAPLRRHAVYIGDLRQSRGLRTMVEAVAATAGDSEPWTLDLVGPMNTADHDWFLARLGADTEHVRWHGRLDPRQSWEIAVGADIGLCLLENTPAFRLAMPSKMYEYLACALPVIATPLPRVAALIDDSRAGVVVTDVAETTAELRRFAADSEHRELLIANAQHWSQRTRTAPSPYDEAAHEIEQVAAGRAAERRPDRNRQPRPGREESHG